MTLPALNLRLWAVTAAAAAAPAAAPPPPPTRVLRLYCP